MKTSILFFASSILFFACSDDSKNVVPESGAAFKVEYIQTGIFDSYKKEIGFSEPLVLEGTQTEVGPILGDVNLTDGKYVFLTKNKIDLLKVTFTSEPKESSSEMAEFVLNVYKDGKRIDNKYFKIAGGGKMSHSWEYKAK